MKTTCKIFSVVLPFVTFLPLPLVAADDQEVSARPNVLFIAIDDLNDWVGCLGGHPDTKTPNIDRLARRGMVFTNAQCAAPACVPSRSALMTGLRPADTGLYSNLNGEYRRFPDLKNLVTIPQYFAQHGYHTMGVGKITHSGPTKTDWDEPSPIVYWKNPLPPGVPENSRRNVAEYLQDWLPLDVKKTEMTDWKMAQWAAQRLQREHDKPFFLACGLYRPHVPLHAPREYYERFPLDEITLPNVKLNDLEDLGPRFRRPNPVVKQIVQNELTWRKGVQAYLANINFADECVGLLLDALDASPYRDNTVVMLWSDHGLHQGEKFQFSKFTLWEEAARCVLICAGPGVQVGTTCHQPVNLLDMYPTLVEMCGLPPKSELSGVSFVPQFSDPGKARERPSITSNEKGFSLRTQRWRYISYRDGSEELYDHENDPMEWDNLADHPDQEEIKRSLKLHVPVDPAQPRSTTR